MAGATADADGDLGLDWSDADLYAFLETLDTSNGKQQVRWEALMGHSLPAITAECRAYVEGICLL